MSDDPCPAQIALASMVFKCTRLDGHFGAHRCGKYQWIQSGKRALHVEIDGVVQQLEEEETKP